MILLRRSRQPLFGERRGVTAAVLIVNNSYVLVP